MTKTKTNVINNGSNIMRKKNTYQSYESKSYMENHHTEKRPYDPTTVVKGAEFFMSICKDFYFLRYVLQGT